jgi:hypothetical protein
MQFHHQIPHYAVLSQSSSLNNIIRSPDSSLCSGPTACPSPNLQHRTTKSNTTHAMYVLRNNEARSYNHYCGRKAMSIKQPECAFVALGIQHAMRHNVICGMPRSAIFFHIFSQNDKNLGKKLLNTNCVFLFSPQICLKQFSF